GFGDQRRRRDNDDIGASNSFRKIKTEAIDNAKVDSRLQRFGPTPIANHLCDCLLRFQGFRQRAANQAETKDCQPPELIGHYASTFFSASRKKAFSSASPTLTRR